jgi:hypothetical protein
MNMVSHFNCTKRTKVGPEYLLEANTSIDVDLESFAPPLPG